MSATFARIATGLPERSGATKWLIYALLAAAFTLLGIRFSPHETVTELRDIPVPRWVKTALVGVGVMAAIAAIGFVGLTHALSAPDGHDDRCNGRERFVRTTWLDSASTNGALHLRSCMVDDLLARHPWVGRHRDDVVAFLGTPPPTGYFRDWNLVYWLGPERGAFAIDSEWLVFRLDSMARVIEVRLVTD